MILALGISFSGWSEETVSRTPRNIVFILTDDHRYDAMGFMGHPCLETPHLDSIARNGVHLSNAFVTTSLCSPSRASILTGLYAHRHGVVDNQHPVRPDLVFFPQLLQRAGYTTGFFGKWHMGGASAEPQRGFDKWVSFRGQGAYWPDRRGRRGANSNRPPAELNVDGKVVPQKGYITDELTDYALEWLRGVPKEKPFLLYLSHKAAHSWFVPADRHAGRYEDEPMPMPASFTHHEHAPMWVQNQRNSHHGAEFAYHSDVDQTVYFRRYNETLLAVDDSVGRVLDELRARGQFEDTLVVYMGDNGFGFGEHGLIDKRTAYEWSMRVPMIAQCLAALPAGATVSEIVANIDIAPTLLEAAGVPATLDFDGQSFWPL
ncbi:MAG: sulfatase family protein, partial [Opitutaceae bacterium]